MSVFRVTLISFEPDNDQEKEAFQKVLTENFEVEESQIASVLANLPSILTENLSKNIAESAVKKLKELGAVVALEEIKGSGGSTTESSKLDDPLDFNFDFDESFSFDGKKEEPTPKESEAAEKSPEKTSEDLSFDFTDETSKPADVLPPEFELKLEQPAEVATPEPSQTEAQAEKDEFDFSFDETTQEQPIAATTEKPDDDFSFDFNETVEEKTPVEENTIVPAPAVEEKVEEKKEIQQSPQASPTEKSSEKGAEPPKEKSANVPNEPEKSKISAAPKANLKKQKTNKKIQLAILAGLSILLLAAFYILDPLGLFKEESSSSSNINSTMVEALLKEQEKILAPVVATPTPVPTPVPLEEKYWESTFENEISTTKAQITTLGSELKQIQFDITTPKPRKLTFSEIAQNKLEPVWIEKADAKVTKKIDDKLAREEKEIAFKVQGSVRTFLSDSVGNERIFADIDIAGNYSKENEKIVGVWEIRYGPITNRLQDYNFVERLSKKEFAVYYKGRFEAVVTDKPKTYELSLESLQKIGVDINKAEPGTEVAPPPPAPPAQ